MLPITPNPHECVLNPSISPIHVAIRERIVLTHTAKKKFFYGRLHKQKANGAHSRIRTEDLRFTRPLLWPTELSEHITGIDLNMRPYSISLNRLFTHLYHILHPYGLVAAIGSRTRCFWVMGPACRPRHSAAIYKDIQTLGRSFNPSGIVSACFCSHLLVFWVRQVFGKSSSQNPSTFTSLLTFVLGHSIISPLLGDQPPRIF